VNSLDSHSGSNANSNPRLDSTRRDHELNELRPALVLALNATAQASAVNRTHRVVRERAKLIQARRNQVRSLWLPMTICSAMIVIFCSAVWSVLDEYELVPVGVPDSRYQIFVLLLWFFPVSASLLGLVWFRRSRNRPGEGVAE
jgi:hypothetical protein